MTVTIVDIAGRSATIDEVIKRSKHLSSMNGSAAPEPQDTAQALLLAGNTLASDAILEGNAETGFRAAGDPTEGALVVAAARFGIEKPHLDQLFPRVGEVPFSSERKRMSTIHQLNATISPDIGIALYLSHFMTQINREYIIFTKGAVDSLLDVCNRAWVDGEIVPMTTRNTVSASKRPTTNWQRMVCVCWAWRYIVVLNSRKS